MDFSVLDNSYHFRPPGSCDGTISDEARHPLDGSAKRGVRLARTRRIGIARAQSTGPYRMRPGCASALSPPLSGIGMARCALGIFQLVPGSPELGSRGAIAPLPYPAPHWVPAFARGPTLCYPRRLGRARPARPSGYLAAQPRRAITYSSGGP